MSIQPAQLLELARALQIQGTEVKLRTCVSRAYYAGFHWCSDAAGRFCRPLNAPTKHTGIHEQIYLQLEQTCHEPRVKSDLRLMAQRARKLRGYRVIADYELGATVDGKDATQSIAIAGNLQKLHAGL
jgi:uncharacterized protein (UPF0332 family)